jgi:hypothetical protein
MTVQDDKEAGQTEKPEPNEENKKQAAEMMEAYQENRPTVVLPGSGGAISGTAVNDWLDDDGNPKYNHDDAGSDDEGPDNESNKEQIEKDKALNDELRKAAAEENKGEKRPS